MEALWLVRNGVPFDTAFAMDDDTRGAFAIVFANFNRPAEEHFDWNSWSFPEPRS